MSVDFGVCSAASGLQSDECFVMRCYTMIYFISSIGVGSQNTRYNCKILQDSATFSNPTNQHSLTLLGMPASLGSGLGTVSGANEERRGPT
jgi:hypothetical protein